VSFRIVGSSIYDHKINKATFKKPAWLTFEVSALLFWVVALCAVEPQENAQEQPGGAGPQSTSTERLRDRTFGRAVKIADAGCE
jgi:hypothetical protein